MDEIKINKAELLERIKANRDEHRKILDEALIGYRSAAIKELAANLKAAKSGGNISRGLSLVEPESHTEDYERIIDMLEMSIDDEIELDAYEFRQYVRNEWSWRSQFLASNAGYSATAAGLA